MPVGVMQHLKNKLPVLGNVTLTKKNVLPIVMVQVNNDLVKFKILMILIFLYRIYIYYYLNIFLSLFFLYFNKIYLVVLVVI